ncbi:pilus assembly protein [Salmonella enterica subsp. enterica serovar Poona]|nr:pilus assembly protein [Salmonella enterica subsp. enterica serovar Poona]HEB6949296.1 TcpQ domain-containing protein [Salmonella enterica subsp. enterica serovar Hvittingfoss]
MKHQEVVGSQRSLNTVASGRTTSATEYSVAQGAPRLTLTLQERHLLSQDISAWAKTQGMSPLWNSNRDYLIYSTINLTGKNRDEVLNQLGQLFLSENYGLVVKLYEKNNVLVIDGQ